MYQVSNLWYIFLAGLQGSKCYSFPLVHCNGECSSLRIHYSETTYPGDFKLWNVVCARTGVHYIEKAHCGEKKSILQGVDYCWLAI